ncbi:hypothetical protein G9A89_002780 [Geosiphon pyriformis]|nr:hypothetical protein G9A89_002780 [Geosiphon pyriformis]
MFSWTNTKYKKLLPILLWDNNRKGKQKEKPTWKTDNLTWINNEQEETSTPTTHILYIYATPQLSSYHRPKLVYVDCDKKLSSIDACCSKENRTTNLVSFQEEMCNELCQYTILISDWIRKETLIEAAWRRTVQQLDSCSYNDDKIWRMTTAKIEGAISKEIRKIKNNPPEPIELD